MMILEKSHQNLQSYLQMGQYLIGYPESVPSPHISIGIRLDHFGPYLVISFEKC